MKRKYTVLLLGTVLSLMNVACTKGGGGNPKAAQPAEKIAAGGWSLGSKSYQFEFTRSSGEHKIQGLVKIVEGEVCLKADLVITKQDDEWLAGHWEESTFAPCAAGNVSLLKIDANLIRRIVRIEGGREMNFADPVFLTNLKSDEIEFAALSYGSGRLDLLDGNRQGIRPIFKTGHVELNGVMIARRVVDDSTYRTFEQIEPPVTLRPIKLTASDRKTAKMHGLANCLAMALDDLRVKDDHYNNRPSNWTPEDARRLQKEIYSNVLSGHLEAYRYNPEVSPCLN